MTQYLFLQKKYRTRGFTLIETLVSVFIITTVVLGPLTVASNALSYARQTKDSITATYLAQEAVELLHHQQDSVYLACQSQTGSSCIPENGETPSQAAWRVFRARLGYNASGVSCYGVDSPLGCAYDFIDMGTNEISNPTKYSSTGTSCSTLSVSQNHVYVCTGAHGNGFTQTFFSRSVTITSLKTFSGGDEDYNDDLRITVTTSFKRPNGFTKKIKVVDFFHARA